MPILSLPSTDKQSTSIPVEIELLSCQMNRHRGVASKLGVPLHRMSRDLLTFITHGVNHITINGQQYDVRQGEALLLPKDAEMVAHFGKKVPLGVININFKLTRVADGSCALDLLPHYVDSADDALPLRRSMEALVHANTHGNAAEIDVAVQQWLLTWARIGVQRQRQQEPACVRQARRLIDEAHGIGLSRKGLAGHCGVSPNYLSRAFRQATGESLKGYMQRVMVERGRQLLDDPALSIGAVAAELGQDIFAFSRLFKRVCCMSPSDYRRYGGI